MRSQLRTARRPSFCSGGEILRIALLGLLTLSLLGGASADESAALRLKYQDRIDQSVDRGLAFLASRQISDVAAREMGQPHLAGSFQDSTVPGNTGITSLAVMAFLAKGHTPGSGPFGETINRGIDFVLRQQLDNGLLISSYLSQRIQTFCFRLITRFDKLVGLF